MTNQPIPIVCDMTGAPDTIEERLEEYRRLFAADLIGRERTEEAVLFRFRARDGLAEAIRDLAAREQACCAFFTFDVRQRGDEITWTASVVDDPTARQILDGYYALPDNVPDSVAELLDQFSRGGLEVVSDADGVMRATADADLGVSRLAE